MDKQEEMITINPNNSFIDLDYDYSKTIKADSQTVLYHYCSLTALSKILETKALLFNCIRNYDNNSNDYERKQVNPCFWDYIFIACFSTNGRSPELWDDFGDRKKGACIKFDCPNTFLIDILDTNRTTIGFNQENKQICSIGYNISCTKTDHLLCSPNHLTDPILDISLSAMKPEVFFTSSLNNDSIDCLNLLDVSTKIPSKYSSECEVRAKGILRSTKRIDLERISYFLVPIRFDRVSLSFGKKVQKNDIKYYKGKLDEIKNSE